jgi:hypothetical protein
MKSPRTPVRFSHDTVHRLDALGARLHQEKGGTRRSRAAVVRALVDLELTMVERDASRYEELAQKLLRPARGRRSDHASQA